MPQLQNYVDIFILAGPLLVVVLGALLWVRQGRVLRALDEIGRREERLIERFEDRVREQEVLLLRELFGDRKNRQEDVHELQRRLLLQISRLYQALERRFGEMQKSTAADAGALRADLVERFDAVQGALARHLSEDRITQQEALARGVESIGRQLTEGLSRNASELGERFRQLGETTDRRLREISGQVEKRLTEGFEKTTETFGRVLEHLSRIDEAQKRINELSSNVVSLQEVLADKRSRGAFGEVQLHALVGNLIPESRYALQHTFSNGTRVDCVIFLPEPSGNIPIDAKFPLESYRRLSDPDAREHDRQQAAAAFRRDIKRHIDDIAVKYILPEETADGAVMFIPAESVFAEIHAHYPDLVEEAFRRRVWMVSPTTMMAILTTARAVLKDAATREQIHVIQYHLNALAKDFGRFRERMDNLSRHINQARRDVDEVHVSARKISERFTQIEKVEFDEGRGPDVPVFRKPEGEA